MKKNFLILVMLICELNSASLKAQGSWTLQTVPPENMGNIGKVHFVSSTEGWICGGGGSLLHTIDTGANWTLVTPFPGDVVVSATDPAVHLTFINTSTFWVIKAFGSFDNPQGAVVYKTTNGGLNWERNVISQIAGDIGLQIQFVDANNGWISIANILSGQFKYFKSTDGGNTWNLMASDGTEAILYFKDSNNGWKILNGLLNSSPPYSIAHTTDGGVNWTQQYIDNTPGKLKAIQFTDINNGWVVGENGKILKTTNGGTNWTPVIIPGITSEYESRCLYFKDATHGWIDSHKMNSGDYGFVLHTTDGGISWTQQNTPVQSSLHSIFFWDENNGWFTSDSQKIGHYTNPLGIKENTLNKSISIYPNPFSFEATIKTDKNLKNATLKMYNLFGQEVKESKNITGREIKLERDNLSNGLYLIRLIEDNTTIVTSKLLIN